jgi:hypothetical protein
MEELVITMTLHLMGGEKLRFSFTPPHHEDNVFSSVAAIKKGIESHQIAAVIDGKLVVVPSTAIQYIEVSPAPENLPSGVLLGATAL